MKHTRYSVSLAIYPLVYLLAGCGASTRPQIYGQGIPVAPRAPAFNPVTDAPVTTGQPGYIAPARMPRSPYGRVLPETPETRKEPGVWAVGAPDDGPMVLGIPMPYPENPDPKAKEPADSCANLIATILAPLPSDPGVRYGKWPLDVRSCLAAKMQADCLSHFMRKWTPPPSAIASALRVTEAARDMACKGVTIPDDIQRYADEIARALRTREVQQ